MVYHIIGAGISGLSLAHLLKKHYNFQVIVFEKENKGGKIQTKYFKYGSKEYFVELGPDSIIFDKEKLEKIEKFFPSLLKQKNFANNNPTYVFGDKFYYVLPTNIWEFFSTKLLNNLEKLEIIYYFLRRFFLGRKVLINNYEDLIRFFGSAFVRKVIEPLFENIFGLPLNELDFKVLSPFLNRLKEKLFYSPTILFNHPSGLKNIVDYFDVDIVNEEVKKVSFVDKLKEGCFVINDSLVSDVIVFTCEAYEISRLLKILANCPNIDENLKSLLYRACSLLDKINYRSSYVNTFILKNPIKLRANGVVFIDRITSLKSISFFSKKWYKDRDLEIIRVFSYERNLGIIFSDLKKFFSFLRYDFESNVLDHFEKYWEKALVNYDSSYYNVIKDLKDIIKALERYNIFIWGGFLSNITDRILFSIENYTKLVTVNEKP